MRSVILSVRSMNDIQNKVSCIKAVRQLTLAGLKEAKDIVERVNPGHAETIIVDNSILEPRYSEALSGLRIGGLTVQSTKMNVIARHGIADEIRRLVTFATMSAQYDIARALLDVMETFCPDPADEFINEEETEDEQSNR